MASDQSTKLAEKAKALYSARWKSEMEEQEHGRYLAIEPNAGECFLGDSYGEAVARAREAHPNQIAFVIRIGYEAAVNIGVLAG